MRDSFQLYDVQDNKTLHVDALQPFSTTRLAVGHFGNAEVSLRQAMKSLRTRRFPGLAPTLVMHQVHLCDGGLCEVEERLLQELGQSVGAARVHVWQGADLTREQLLAGRAFRS